MSKLLLVDGYNLIHQLDRYKRLASDSVLAIRQLANDLSNLASVYKWQVIIVLDGGGEAGRQEVLEGQQVIYSGIDQTADAVIERLVSQSQGEVMVATSDYAQQKVISRLGVKRISARDFQILIDEYRKELREKLESRQHYRGSLASRLPKEILDKLEKMRRGDS